MKKLVIIGANNFQLPLIKKAGELGMETHVFAWEKGAVGRECADHYYPISIIEKELILKEVEKINPDGIISIGSDLAMATVNYIADGMGLIGNSLACVRVTTDKFAMRECLSQGGLPCPKYSKSADIQEILNICGDFPLIVKPTDRSGSRGVTRVSSKTELEQAIVRARSVSFSLEHIVEQFIAGREYSVEMISWKGEHHFLQITEKETSGEPHYVEKAHHQPAALPAATRDKIITLVDKALTCLKVEYGASHSEILLAAEGDVFIVEIGARMGGDYIGSHLVELSTGYDYVRGVIEIACGHFDGVEQSRQAYAGIYYVFAKPGMVSRITNYAKKFPEILFSEIYFRAGSQTREVIESNDRAACFVYRSSLAKFVPSEKIIIIE
ncbi:MAG: ATP-grasp domain-containing protein [Candidatus Aminicenantes bacterium]|nr:ATP-grasp domain-containing protein [Candidatus Aminicenantes bacterium]